MHVKSLEIYNFRNIEQASLSLHSVRNILKGPNGQGKTNTIESLYLALSGKSHRENTLRNFVGPFSESSAVNVKIVYDDASEYDVRLQIGEDKKIFVNEEPVKRRSELIRLFPCIFFGPEDLRLVKGAPSVRRGFVDEAIAAITPQYAALLRGYLQVVSQKNVLLKEYRPSSESLLEVYNESFLRFGADVIRYRLRFLKELSKYFIVYYETISQQKESIAISYASAIFHNGANGDINTLLQNTMQENQARELTMRTTVVGPHLDDIYLMLDRRNARKFASQGQQRTIALCLKLALIDLFFEKNGERPIVLLDDVMSELDAERQGMVLEAAEKAQSFLTCADDSFAQGKTDQTVFSVSGGTIVAEN
jgi:DNA replication and repair protein RecF